jgi:hypothetical protein
VARGTTDVQHGRPGTGAQWDEDGRRQSALQSRSHRSQLRFVKIVCLTRMSQGNVGLDLISWLERHNLLSYDHVLAGCGRLTWDGATVRHSYRHVIDRLVERGRLPAFETAGCRVQLGKEHPSTGPALG